MFEDGTILITGGTGSFGKTMTRRLLEHDIGEIRILSRDEEKQESMRIELQDDRAKFYIGDIRDIDSVNSAMQGVDFVFHAAALKQVPSCEFFPIEAVRTNILGSSNVVEAAISASVKSVVCLSTDKAVFPINAMGATKALMEKTANAASRRLGKNGTVISCVRYGNVMYSRGSVIPLFVKQILDGLPLTVTEPSMTRFMLPLTEAVSLVEFALANADQGDIFIRKAPACTIDDLITALKNLFDADNPVQVIGMRHGEKIYETLASAEEMLRSEDMGDYFRVRSDNRSLNYAQFTSEGDPDSAETRNYHSHNTERLDVKGVEDLLLALPEIRAALETRKQVNAGSN